MNGQAEGNTELSGLPVVAIGIFPFVAIVVPAFNGLRQAQSREHAGLHAALSRQSHGFAGNGG
jgi:hypothetical protein